MFRRFLPLAFCHINTAVFPENNTFRCQQASLFRKAGRHPACVINDSVTRVLPVMLSHGKNPAYQSRIPVTPDQPGNLPISCHLAFRDFLHHR